MYCIIDHLCTHTMMYVSIGARVSLVGNFNNDYPY